jgi:hypothetical protein
MLLTRVIHLLSNELVGFATDWLVFQWLVVGFPTDWVVSQLKRGLFFLRQNNSLILYLPRFFSLRTKSQSHHPGQIVSLLSGWTYVSAGY